MALSIAARIKALERMSVPQLREKWQELYGEETRQRHRRHLIKRLAYRTQELEFGGLSDETRARIDELRQEFENTPPSEWLKDGKWRTSPPPKGPRTPGVRDPRLPAPGTVLTRSYKGSQIIVKVLDRGFEHRGQVYRSLSAIAREITGSHWNGLLFFGLTRSSSK